MNWSAIISTEKRSLIVLIDPDKYFSENNWLDRANLFNQYRPDAIFLGGSHLTNDYSGAIISILKKATDLSVIAFPGDYSHLHEDVDGVLFLSLISGRNPEYLINQQVKSAMGLKKQGMAVLPTGYMLIDGGASTSVQYVTQTQPIPSDKTSLAVATAVAGELLGLKAIYLEAGSGAKNPVPAEMVHAVKSELSIPLIVGGGIRDAKTARLLYEAGADVLVVGNGFEKNPGLLEEVAGIRDAYKAV